jgi:hypothetical protein
MNLTAEGISSHVFDPGESGWLYARGRSVFFRPLPGGRGGDRLLARHAADARLGLNSNLHGRVYAYDASGEIRLWSFTPSGPKLERVLRRPDTAPAASVVDPSGGGSPRPTGMPARPGSGISPPGRRPDR